MSTFSFIPFFCSVILESNQTTRELCNNSASILSVCYLLFDPIVSEWREGADVGYVRLRE